MIEEELFHAALAKSAAERAAFLEQACAGDASLRAAVEALLAAHEAPGSFLNPSPQNVPLQGDFAPTQVSDGVAEAKIAAKEEHVSDSASGSEKGLSQQGTTDFYPHPMTNVVIGGRYTLREKIGEGGMGTVWIAKQTEPVKRKVALKLIKTGMDSRVVLQRFGTKKVSGTFSLTGHFSLS